MKTLCDIAVSAAQDAGARYVEARTTHRHREVVGYKDAAIDNAFSERDKGIGIRALVGDAYGYAATNATDPDAVVACARRAVEAARAAAPYARHEVVLPDAVQGSYHSHVKDDPFAHGADEKLAIFADAHGRILGTPNIVGARGSYLAQRTETTFRASNGTAIDQSVTLCGGGITAIAAANGDVQVRSAPKSQEGNVLQGGFEHLLALGLADEATRIRDEALALLEAEVAPTGPTTIILDGAMLSLQIHESVGHPTELDRVFGEEISLAGASFLLPENLEQLRFGTELVDLVADGTTPLGPGTFGFDDEGTPARRSHLVKDGLFKGYLSGRDSAHRLGHASAGALRAENWAAVPIVRMVNVNLEPGEGSLDDLIAGVDDGMLLSNNKSWSIDDLRLNFQFGCEIAYEIKGGRRTGKIFKNPVYRGVTPKFWNCCSAIAGPEAWQMWGWMFCGKGDPMQIMHVGHGCAPARFDGVHLGAP